MGSTRFARLLFLVATSLYSPALLSGQADRPDQTAIARDLPGTIPLFAFPDAMLFPNAPRRLSIDEARDRALLADAMKVDRIVGVVMLQPGFESVSGSRPAIFPVGCAGVITNVEELPDGRVNVLVRGLVKFRVTAEDDSRAYRVGHVVPIPEIPNVRQASALKVQRERLDDLVSLSIDHFGIQPPPLAVPDEDVVNVVSQYADIHALERQALLEQDGVLARSRALVDLLEVLSKTPR